MITRNRRIIKQPDLMIIPMIDIMFFLLVFFMLATMYMVELRTIPVKLPPASNSTLELKTSFAISLKQDGTLWIEDKQTNINSLVLQLKTEKSRNPNISIIVRADKNAEYGQVVTLLDKIKSVGINKFALATDNGVAAK